MDEFLRPEAEVLGEGTTIPEENVTDKPTTFSHVVVRRTAYCYSADSEPAGSLSEGDLVLLRSRDLDRCEVVDRNGVILLVPCNAIRAIPASG